MRKKVGICAAMVAAMVLLNPVSASDVNGTLEEAQALLKKAHKHFNAVGEAQALKDFNVPNNQFMEKDLYVFCIAKDGITTAHPINSNLVLRKVNLNVLKDPDGKPFGKEMIELGNTKGSGFVSYKWFNKKAGKIQPKKTYIQAMGGQICGVGAYVN